MESTSEREFKRKYASHLKHLKLKGLQPKTIDAYARAILASAPDPIIASTICQSSN